MHAAAVVVDDGAVDQRVVEVVAVDEEFGLRAVMPQLVIGTKKCNNKYNVGKKRK